MGQINQDVRNRGGSEFEIQEGDGAHLSLLNHHQPDLEAIRGG